MFIVEHYHGRRFWIESQGWATTDEAEATRYSRENATTLAHQMHGEVVELN
jgi:hypothetical protein